MKTRSYLIVATATALTASAWAQENRPFTPPPPLQPPPTEPKGQPPSPEQKGQPSPEAPASRSPDGSERREDGRGPGHHMGRMGRPEPEMRNQPFLGVVTRSAPEELRAQLNLPEGFGLIVDEVLPNSPAANAGVQKYDVLKQLNDQQLTNPEQLATLVRAAGKDKQVTLTVIRQGQEQKLTVTVGEHPVPQHPPMLGRDPLVRPVPAFPRMDGRFGENADKWREQMQQWGKEMQERSQRWGKDAQEQAERGRKEVERQMREFKDMKAPGDSGPRRIEVRPETLLFESRPGANGQIQVSTNSSVTTLDGAKAHLVVRDNDGEIEISNDNGKRVMTAKSPDGKVVFNGPVDTDEQRKAVPEQFRKKLELLKGIQVRSASSDGDATASVELEDVLTDSPNVQ